MVCKKCEKKLGQLPTAETWKVNSPGPTVKTRKVGKNKLLASKSSSSKMHFSPYSKQCRLCKSSVHQPHANYCQDCAYKKGICAMCGKQILDVSVYKNTSK